MKDVAGFLMLVSLLGLAWFSDPVDRRRRLLAFCGLILISVVLEWLSTTDTAIGRAVKDWIEL